MDCFCGSGKESSLLGRDFIDIHESKEAIKVNQKWIEEFNQQNLISF